MIRASDFYLIVTILLVFLVYSVSRPVESIPVEVVASEDGMVYVAMKPVVTVGEVRNFSKNEECSINNEQLNNIQFSYTIGKDHDLGYTLAAIAIKESNAGKWKVNVQDPSGGLYHVTADKVLKRYGWEDSSFNRNRAIQLLIDDDSLAAELAIETLLFWKEENSGNWLETWASYNHGYMGTSSERGMAYAQDIRSLIQRIQSCKWVY